MHTFKRAQYSTLKKRLEQPRMRIQILTGPRQIGKTTLIHQVLESLNRPFDFHSADAMDHSNHSWIEHIWTLARKDWDQQQETQTRILIIDEIQKVPNWAEMVKRLWDQDTADGRQIQIVLLGSSPLLLQKGMTESLMGRFERIQLTHWTWPEMNAAFGWDLDTFIFYGGYPGAAPFLPDEERWAEYVIESLVEPTLSRDVYDIKTIQKPALMRKLFDFGVDYSSQIISYTKMLGQLHDAGNTVTIAEYLTLLEKVSFLCGLEKYDPAGTRKRRSSPKLNVFNMALMNAPRIQGFDFSRRDQATWGRIVEAAVGAHLLNGISGSPLKLYYWRERDLEVDFVLESSAGILGIEVKSGTRIRTRTGMKAFSKRFPGAKTLMIGGGGLELSDFFSQPVKALLK